jgi:hypothetical protein
LKKFDFFHVFALFCTKAQYSPTRDPKVGPENRKSTKSRA